MTWFDERCKLELETRQAQEKEIAFNKQFRQKVESGYTLDQFKTDFCPTDEQIKQFSRLQGEVADEKLTEAAFLAGFNSVPVRRG